LPFPCSFEVDNTSTYIEVYYEGKNLSNLHGASRCLRRKSQARFPRPGLGVSLKLFQLAAYSSALAGAYFDLWITRWLPYLWRIKPDCFQLLLDLDKR
jgi:hypothetical protein